MARLGRLARQLSCAEYAGYVLISAGSQLPTSTFGRVVFWDETAALAPAEATAVLTHVRQRHALGVLWLQIWRIVL